MKIFDANGDGVLQLSEYIKLVRYVVSMAALQYEEGIRQRGPESGGGAGLFAELRPTAIDAVKVIFGQEMERVLRELVESGKTAKLPTPKKRHRKS